MKSVVSGNTKNLRATERAELEKLALRRSNPKQLIDLELARRAATISANLSAQIGLLIGRDGRIVSIVVGSRDRLFLPDLGRFRLDPGRLRRIRLVVFMPDAEQRLQFRPRGNSLFRTSRDKSEMVMSLDFPQDFLTDLEKLRLDALILVAVTEDGYPGPMSFAHLEPAYHRELRNARERNISIGHYHGRDLRDIEIDFETFISEVESQFAAAIPSTIDLGSDRAILVGAYTGTFEEARASMEELQELVRTAGIAVADVIVQRRRDLDPRTVIGKGKVEQVVLQSLELGADLIIFDRELSPSQLRSITNLTELRVIDRSMLILDIFAQRAKSSEGRLQVELAQLRYSLPRLTEKDSGLSRLTGGIGGRGPGETKLEIGRRRVRDRIADLEGRIEKLAMQREVRRHRRQERGVPVVAIVGYTNSGKSTLLNQLTKSEVLAESKLFATLDPASRRMRFPNDKEVIFVDTVGFIRDLPDELVNAFRATLEEVGEADLLVHLVDASSIEMRRQMEVVTATLEGLKFGEKPKILALNKIDLLSEQEARTVLNSLGAIGISALKREGFAELLNEIQNRLGESFSGRDPGRFLGTPIPPVVH